MGRVGMEMLVFQGTVTSWMHNSVSMRLELLEKSLGKPLFQLATAKRVSLVTRAQFT